MGDIISKQKAMMILAKQMRVLPTDIKENRMEWFEKYLTDGFEQHRLATTLYEDFYHTPYCQPKYSSLVSIADVKNRKRFGVIFRGIRGYMEASAEERKAFRKTAYARASLLAVAKYTWYRKRDDLERN
jgi:hypothetical protein